MLKRVEFAQMRLNGREAIVERVSPKTIRVKLFPTASGVLTLKYPAPLCESVCRAIAIRLCEWIDEIHDPCAGDVEEYMVTLSEFTK